MTETSVFRQPVVIGDDRYDRLQPDGYPVQAHVKSTIRKRSCLEKKTGHMPVIDRHLIPFTGADSPNTFRYAILH